MYNGVAYAYISVRQLYSGNTPNAYIECLHYNRNAPDTGLTGGLMVFIPTGQSQSYTLENDSPSWCSFVLTHSETFGDYNRYDYAIILSENTTREDRTAKATLIYSGVVCDEKVVMTQYRHYVSINGACNMSGDSNTTYVKIVSGKQTSADTYTLYSNLPYHMFIVLTGATCSIQSGWTFDYPSGTTTFTVTPQGGTQGVAQYVARIQITDAGIGRTSAILDVHQNGDVTTGNYLTANTTSFTFTSESQRSAINLDTNVYGMIKDYPNGLPAGGAWCYLWTENEQYYVQVARNSTGSPRSMDFPVIVDTYCSCPNPGTWDTSQTLYIHVEQSA